MIEQLIFLTLSKPDMSATENDFSVEISRHVIVLSDRHVGDWPAGPALLQYVDEPDVNHELVATTRQKSPAWSEIKIVKVLVTYFQLFSNHVKTETFLT